MLDILREKEWNRSYFSSKDIKRSIMVPLIMIPNYFESKSEIATFINIDVQNSSLKK